MSKQSYVHKMTPFTGIALVLTNYEWNRCFTILGFQLKDLSNIAVLLMLWVLKILLLKP